MTTYQLAPYLLSVRPSGSQGDIRPLDDVDANGGHLIDLVERTLTAVLNISYQLPGNYDTTFRVSDVARGARAIFYSVTRGSSGIRSVIDSADEDEVFDRQPKHFENIQFRNLVLFPTRSSYALLISERIGGRGITAFNHKLLKETIQANLSGSLVTVQPLVSAADLENVPILLNSINFEFPRKTDPEGRFMDVSGIDGFFSLKFKFRKAKKLSNFVNAEGGELNSKQVFGVINPALTAAGVGTSGDQLKELGVQAKLNVTLPSGNTRTFTFGRDEGPALVYALAPETPILASPDQANVDQPAAVARPENPDFMRVAKEIVSEVQGSFTIPGSAIDDCQVPAEHPLIEIPSTWKVVWNVPDHTVPSSS